MIEGLPLARMTENAIHLTAFRAHCRHDCTGRLPSAPANDRFDSDAAYFARLRAALIRQMRGE